MARISRETRLFESMLPALMGDLEGADRSKVLRAIEILAAHSANSGKALPVLLHLAATRIDRHVVRGARIAIETIAANVENPDLGQAS